MQMLFTAVLVQKCFSKCYFKIGSTIVKFFKLLSSVSVVSVAFGSSYCMNDRKKILHCRGGICLKTIVNLIKK